MRRSHSIVTVLCAILCVCIVLRLERHRLRNRHAAAHAPTPVTSSTPARGGDGMKTNAATAGASDGLFLGKDKLLYVNYGTRDPALQSFMKAVMSGSYDTTAKGRAIFLKVCAACHQPDGMGKEGVGPPLTGSEWVLAPQGDRLVRIVLNGMSRTGAGQGPRMEPGDAAVAGKFEGRRNRGRADVRANKSGWQ